MIPAAKRALALLSLLLSLLPVTASAWTDENGLIFFRIGNGGTSGTYYPVGGILATAISNPPGGNPCDKGGACGVPGVLAAAMASAGSVANIAAIRDGDLESAFAQSDIAHWAQTGTGSWADQPPVSDLRAIARLFPEAIHLIARADSGVETLADLAGKRVSLDMPGSGTMVDAQLVLDAAGLDQTQLTVVAAPAQQAAEMMQQGDLDAFFFVGGWPAPLLSELSAKTEITLVPIVGAAADKLLQDNDFFARGDIPAGSYPGVDEAVPTLMVGALWVTLAEQPDDLIYAMTRVLWNDNTMRQLNFGHPAGRRVQRAEALTGISIPLHPGAARYYREAGLLPAP